MQVICVVKCNVMFYSCTKCKKYIKKILELICIQYKFYILFVQTCSLERRNPSSFSPEEIQYIQYLSQ